MKYLFVIMLLSVAGWATLTPYEQHLWAHSLQYDQRPDYIERRAAVKLPKDYSTEDKLRLIAHGFDPHIRLVLGCQLADEMKLDDQLSHEVANFMESEDPSLAWAFDKCIDSGPDPMSTYSRPDVRKFEGTYHK